MGLLTSVNNLNYTLEEEKKKQAAERARRQKERIKKENLQRIYIDLEEFTKTEFDNYIIESGSTSAFIFYNREEKTKIFNNFINTLNENEKTIYFKDLQRYYNKKYCSILKKSIQEQKQQEYYEEQKEAEEKKEKIKKNKIDAFFKNSKNIDKIIIIILLVPLIPILFILFIILRMYEKFIKRGVKNEKTYNFNKMQK